MAIKIRPVKTIEEYHDCEDLQQRVWRFDDREIIPVNELITIQRSGGVVLGAFERNGRMIGFVFGLPGLVDREVVHCSRMLAVLPEFRNSGIGMRLKLEQRKFALDLKIRVARWTFDPLQGLNAYFNIEKLGVIAREYLPNLYGHSTSILNRGLETDRFVAEWWLKSKHVIRHLKDRSDTPPIATIISDYADRMATNTEPVSYSMRQCRSFNCRLTSRRVFVEIPENIQAVKSENIALACDWRTKTRHIFTLYFKKGYVVVGFSSGRIEEARRSFYLLEKGSRVWTA
jgi:predicted GNAT superfamily acetyltransferase